MNLFAFIGIITNRHWLYMNFSQRAFAVAGLYKIPASGLVSDNTNKGIKSEIEHPKSEIALHPRKRHCPADEFKMPVAFYF